MTNTLAIIAAGAMGSAIARRMAENGARVLTPLKGRSQATVDRALQAGMISASYEEIAAHAELVRKRCTVALWLQGNRCERPTVTDLPV